MLLLSQAKLLFQERSGNHCVADTLAPSAVSTIPLVNKPHVHVGHEYLCIYTQMTAITQSSKQSKVKKVQNYPHWRFGQYYAMFFSIQIRNQRMR